MLPRQSRPKLGVREVQLLGQVRSLGCACPERPGRGLNMPHYNAAAASSPPWHSLQPDFQDLVRISERSPEVTDSRGSHEIERNKKKSKLFWVARLSPPRASRYGLHDLERAATASMTSTRARRAPPASAAAASFSRFGQQTNNVNILTHARRSWGKPFLFGSPGPERSISFSFLSWHEWWWWQQSEREEGEPRKTRAKSRGPWWWSRRCTARRSQVAASSSSDSAWTLHRKPEGFQGLQAAGPVQDHPRAVHPRQRQEGLQGQFRAVHAPRVTPTGTWLSFSSSSSCGCAGQEVLADQRQRLAQAGLGAVLSPVQRLHPRGQEERGTRAHSLVRWTTGLR